MNGVLKGFGPSRGLAGFDAESTVVQTDGNVRRIVGFDPARRSIAFANPDGLTAIFVNITSAVSAGQGFPVPPNGVILFSNPPWRVLPELEWFGVTAGLSKPLIVTVEYELTARALYHAYAQASGGDAMGRYSRRDGGGNASTSINAKPIA